MPSVGNGGQMVTLTVLCWELSFVQNILYLLVHAAYVHFNPRLTLTNQDLAQYYLSSFLLDFSPYLQIHTTHASISSDTLWLEPDRRNTQLTSSHIFPQRHLSVCISFHVYLFHYSPCFFNSLTQKSIKPQR